MKKASQSSQSALTGLEEALSMATKWVAASSADGAGAEKRLAEETKAWMGAKNGFGGLLPRTLNIGVIWDQVEVGAGKGGVSLSR